MIDRRSLLSAGASLAALLPLRALAAERGLDVALTNARVWTPGGGVRLSAVGIVGERIAAVGTDQVKALATSATKVVDLKGAFLMPAFTDNHTHFLIGSTTLSQADLLSATDRADFAARIGAVAKARPGKWILGGSWDEQRLGGALPTHEWIDAVTPDTPVAVPRTDLHLYLLNKVAMKLAGITRDTPDPPGGVIVRDANGEPTGVVKDNAKALVERVIPALSDADTDAIMRQGIAHALSKGVAQIHNPEISWSTYESLRRLRAKGETDTRFYAFVPLVDWEKMAAIVAQEGRGDDWLRWGALKGLADGSLGSRTAVFHDHYDDAPDQSGVRVTTLANLREWITAADKIGLHVTTHAIGDQANDDILDIYAEVEKTNGVKDRRFRIEHAQHLSQAAIPRFAKQKVIASVQPYHAIDDGRWAVKRIGAERLKGTYAFKSLMDAGATVTFGSDWPVAPLDPLTGLYGAVTRRTIDGANPNGWLPEQKVSMEQALTAYTINNAFAGFMDDRTGKIAPGYYADLTVLDADLTTIDPLKIPDVKVLHTFVGGKARYSA
ncbi:amidohydrolase [Caulobacter segnis]|jgi:predicted amidohydrolase YtcJ|uniref:amidohydrolase n=1 Tax=Caulobacter segnis TaxID=88688 RepID=UPI001CBED41E|nr:amidohydrolase [Caulobacter segnis]UAL12606.1 amidohydrolase [Caulobacter segnis]